MFYKTLSDEHSFVGEGLEEEAYSLPVGVRTVLPAG